MGSRWRPGFAIALLVAGACGGREPASTIVRDSAGVEIVENLSPAQATALEIDPTPLADIGGLEAPHAEFPGPVSSAFRGRGGSIVVVAWTATRVAVFDSAGTWLHDIGRPGSGPGEFEGLGWAFSVAGDSIVSYEPFNRRLQLFSPAGEFVRIVSLIPPTGFEYPRIQGATAAGLVATARRYQPPPDDYALASIGYTLFAFSPGGSAADSLLELPPTERIWIRGGTWSRPFDVGNVVRVAGERILVAHTGRLAVRVHDGRGRLTRIVRIGEEPRSLGGDEYQGAVDSILEGLRNPSQREAMRRAYASAPANRLAPAFDDLALDREGGFWLWRTPAPRIVSVIDSSGRWLGDATLPEGLRPVELGPDWVLGTWTDVDGVVHVRLHRFRRAARDA
ncbi:MAG: hypothetical protein R2909_13720 [Gemmatimonadales bacterium]